MPRKRRKKQAAPKDIKPRAFVPRPCSMCTKHRPAQTNYSVVYGKVGRVRYCKCRFCHNTWTQSISADQMPASTTGIVNEPANCLATDGVNRQSEKHGISSISTGTD